MERRNFIKSVGAAGVLSLIGNRLAPPLLAAPATDKPLFITATCPGGWDVSLFCDPRYGADFPLNRFGEGDLRKFGPFTLGPGSAAAVQFFERYSKKIMLLNGVFAETIDHGVGQRLACSGGAGTGFPCFDALVAASLGPTLGLSFISGGGYDETAHEIAKTLSAPSLIQAMSSTIGKDNVFSSSDTSAISASIAARLKRKQAQAQLAIRQKNMNLLAQARQGWGAFPGVLKTVADLQAKVPLVQGVTGDDKAVKDYRNQLFLSIQLALAGYVNNATVSANIAFGNCDQHSNFPQHHLELDGFFIGMDYLWRAAEYLGISDRLNVMMGSDFSRSPFAIGAANDQGKEHWAQTTSIILMGTNVPGETLIGSTTRDKSFKAEMIDPKTLKPAASGVPLLRSHVHNELRRIAGIQDHPIVKKYPLILPGGPIRILA
ncbi:MAG: DUF1501 domain-containing protein [Bdellovibrionota bacterium]